MGRGNGEGGGGEYGYVVLDFLTPVQCKASFVICVVLDFSTPVQCKASFVICAIMMQMLLQVFY